MRCLLALFLIALATIAGSVDLPEHSSCVACTIPEWDRTGVSNHIESYLNVILQLSTSP